MLDHHPTLPPSSFPMFEMCAHFKSGESGAAAESGSRQHALLAALLTGAEVPPNRFGCDAEEVKNVSWAEAYITNRTSAGREVEKRLSLINDDFEEVTFGTLDVVQVVNRATGDQLVVMDYKSGEEHNYLPQMAVYARMAMLSYGLDRCEIHEVFGRKRFANTYTLNFSDTDFIFSIIDRVNAGEEPPHMNAFCSWCEKHGTCSAATEPIVRVATEYEPEHAVAGLPMDKVATWHASEIVDPTQMSIVLQVAEHIGKWADAVKAHARKAALGGMAIPGYVLKPGRRAREITDLNVAFEVSGLSASEFLSCCKGSVPQLEEAVARKNGFSSAGGKAAKEGFKTLLGNYIVFKEGAPTLARA
ncbi:MAG: DUF2800 domain-containing protein [Planctomycetaceae bacterium]|nr:DUF2800 domain-containing protein [Planctomycetaceae bacterium]